MRIDVAYATLRALGVPVLQTSDAAAALRKTIAAAGKILSRLAETGLVINVRHGLWWIDGSVDLYRLTPHLTAPYESYVSLQTALYLRGMIEQIAVVTYAVTLARTQRIATVAGPFSFHHIAPESFGGYEEGDRGARIATAEKALSTWPIYRPAARGSSPRCPSSSCPAGFGVRSSSAGSRRFLRSAAERSRSASWMNCS